MSLTPGQALEAECKRSRYLLSGSGIELARRLGYTAKHICEVFHDKAPISVQMALRLEYVLQLPASHWTDLQNEYDLTRARRRARGASLYKGKRHLTDLQSN